MARTHDSVKHTGRRICPFARILGLCILTGLVTIMIKDTAAGQPMGRPAERSGFACANFGIAGEFSPEGQVFGQVMVNPSRLGEWLWELGHGSLAFAWGSTMVRTEELEIREIHRDWPLAEMTVADSRFDELAIEVKAFAPIADHDPQTTSLPLLLLEIGARNLSDASVTFDAAFTFTLAEARAAGAFESALFASGDDTYRVGFLPHVALATDQPEAECNLYGQTVELLVPLDLEAGASGRIRILLAWYEPEGIYANVHDDVLELAVAGFREWERLEARTREFARLLPVTGEADLDRYARWYTSAAVILTRLTRDGSVVTLGYRELNQRDSFWTSPAHLVYWPALERKMIEQTAAHQGPGGKIPTTLLPVIDREDDLDINAYYVLRVFRYYDWTRDGRFLKVQWPSVKRAMEWLAARDTDGDGLPEQQSYWGDWKDVPGVAGRTVSPYAAHLWCAALRAAMKMAWVCGDGDYAARCEARELVAYDYINRTTGNGGLWAGTFYANRWADGRDDPHVQQDQIVGAFFDTMPEARRRTVLETLEASRTVWGVRETWPYRPESFGYAPGEYHNGGIWPWLCAVEAWSRYRHGDREGGDWILRAVGAADLEEDGDWLPHEWIRGTDGRTVTEFTIQGWNAAWFGALLFGRLGLDRVEDRVLRIAPVIDPDASFETALRLPEGVLRVAHHATGDGAARITLTPDFSAPLTLCYVPPATAGRVAEPHWFRSVQRQPVTAAIAAPAAE